MSVLVYDCGSVENTVTAILDTESGAMIIRGNGDVDNYLNEYSPWYSEHSNITQVTVDKGITRIGSGTFYGCENLSFVEIANTVTSIGTDVFKNCTALSRIKIPKTITNIGNGAFTDSGLTEVRFYGNPPTVGADIFDGITADVYTPEGNEEWTQTAKGTVAGNGSILTWKTFDSKPNLIEYDELDYLWSKIKKYVDNNVSVTPVLTSGTKIATITVNGVDTDLYSSSFSGTVGNKLKPIYIDNGVPTECDDLKYPDGEIINLNAKGLTTSSIAEVDGVIDSSGNGNHGQAYGGVTVVKNDELGDCFYFNSTTQHQYLNFNRSFDFSQSFTIYFVTKGDYANRPAFFECRDNDWNKNFFISSNNNTTGNNGPFRLRYKVSGTPAVAWSSVNLVPGTLYKIAITYDATNSIVKFYVNGALDSEHDVTGIDLGASDYFMIGSLPEFDESRNLNGFLTDIRIYPRALSDSEVKTLYIIGSKSTYTGNAYHAENATQDGSGNTITSTYATIAKTYDDTTNTSYRGMLGKNGANNAWVRTTTEGIIPYQKGAAGSGHCGLGTSLWYFATAYIDNIYGKLNGNCTGSSASCTGNAATATTATNSTNSKLTHTIDRNEYPLVFGSSFTVNDSQQALRIGTPTTDSSACPLRAMAYCAAANTQGEGYIVLGNNIAKTAVNNARGSIYIFGQSTYRVRVLAEPAANKDITIATTGTTARTYTLPDATGTIALTSSNITGSSASCTGNAATATTASACSGNAATATLATGSTNIRVTNTDSNTWYPLVFSSGSSSNTNYAARVDSDSILVNPGTSPAANTQGNCYLQLGNNKATATAGNKRGRIIIYGVNTSYSEIVSGVGTTARTITLPDKAGTVALTSDIPASSWCTTKATTSSTASSTKPAVVVENYKSGTSWRRVWSDGWIEQGGRITCSSSGVQTISIVEMVDTNYNVHITLGDPTGSHFYNGNLTGRHFQASNLTTTSFQVYLTKESSNPSIGTIQWSVRGYKK